MAIGDDKIADLRVKHLEMTQAVVARLAAQSNTIKGIAVTLTTAVCGLAASQKQPDIALFALGPILALAILDALYLRIERRLRDTFNEVRQGDWSELPTFEISSRRAKGEGRWRTVLGFCRAATSWSILIFYGVLVAGALLAWRYIKAGS